MKITKEILQYVVDNWETTSAREMADKLGVKTQNVYGWVSAMRQQGINLTKKGGQGGTIRNFVQDYLEKHPEKKREGVNLDKVFSDRHLKH